jgi:hypothetical protein
VNYSRITEAVEFYSRRGYIYLEDAPWHVGREAYYMTKPDDAVDIMLMACGGGNVFERPYAVASGEQSFIQMMLDGQFLKRHVCVTPCFRWEPRVDMLHRRYFMKAELINAQDVDDGHLIDMVHDACSFFERFVSVRVIRTAIGYDIVEKGTRFELGSYGIRERYPADQGRPALKWIYGTACAEPRLSTTIEKGLRHQAR